jgi:hypothetical protein
MKHDVEQMLFEFAFILNNYRKFDNDECVQFNT